jgi:tRNA-(ms[2]io[6]A)-hydroxylase
MTLSGSASLNQALAEIDAFLGLATPAAWIDEALKQQDVLLVDHANCEKKAAATAMQLMFKHTLRGELLRKMSQLAREELLHFQQVVELMEARGVSYRALTSSRYAAGLFELVDSGRGEGLVDTLVVGAFIEARSCERFACLIPELQQTDPELARFYKSLLRSEARHYRDYLDLAASYWTGSASELKSRIEAVRRRENQLISEPDVTFRFHSGPPESVAA